MEQRVNDDTDGEMTLAVIQQTVVAALTAYNASTGQQVADVQTAVNLLPTLTTILQDPMIVQLIANAATAAANGGGTGTGGTALTATQIREALLSRPDSRIEISESGHVTAHKVKQFNQQVKHTLNARVVGVSNTTTETLVE